MTKKILAVIAALAVLLSMTAFAETYTLDGVCTLTFPEGYQFDSDVTEQDDDSWKFSAFSDIFELDFYVQPEFDDAGKSLYKYSEAELQEYIDDVVEANTGDGMVCEYLKTETVNQIPFVYTLNYNEDGEVMYCAETMANGTGIYAVFYDYEEYADSDELLEELTAIMSTFVPAT